MVPAGMFAVELPVDHVGDPRERMPVRRMKRCKRPLDALRGYPPLHLRVLYHIVVIVQRYEIVAPHTTVGKNGGRHKNEADGGNPPGFTGYGSNGNGLFGRRFWRALAAVFPLVRFAGHSEQSPIVLKTAGWDTSGL